LGVEGYVSAGACRRACQLGIQQSLARAELALAELAGWTLDDNTLRQLCHATAARGRRDQRAPAAAAEAARLALTQSQALTVLGDGAERVWNLAAAPFAGAAEVLDDGHGVEHLRDAALAAFGADSVAAQSQAARDRLRLREDGYGGVSEWVGEVAGQVPAGGDGAALGGVLDHFAVHQRRLNDALRWRRGQSVGSGLVEGSIKQLWNKRVKQTGARWKGEQVGPFVEWGALGAGPEGQAWWERNGRGCQNPEGNPALTCGAASA
jgi:hypothetical protein